MSQSIDQAVILSAGLGTRMADLTVNLPKPMLPYKDKPLVEHQLLWLKEWGIEEFFINLYYLPEKVMEYLGDGDRFGVKIHYNIEKELLGTGGAYLAFREKLSRHFIAVNCDVTMRLDLKQLISFHLNNQNSATMAVYCPHEPMDYSSVRYSGTRLTDIAGKLGKAGEEGIFTGLQVLSDEIFTYLPQGISSIISAFYLPALEKNKRIGAFTEIDTWVDLGTKALYEKRVR